MTTASAHRVGILDTKVGRYYLEDIAQYKARGFEIITSTDLNTSMRQYDVLVACWTKLSRERLARVTPKVVVIKDNDEPDNVVAPEVLRDLGIPYVLIGDWGVSTRVAWNCAQLQHYMTGTGVAIVGQTSTHDVLAQTLRDAGHAVAYPLLPLTTPEAAMRAALADAHSVIVHLGIRDYPRFWLDGYFASMRALSVLISTTRGPLYRADALRRALAHQLDRAILDWVWDEKALRGHARIVFTKHTSYQSPQSRRELTAVTLEAIDHALSTYCCAHD